MAPSDPSPQVVEDDSLEEEDKVARCMRLAGHADWRAPPPTAADRRRREAEVLLRLLEDPARAEAEKAEALHHFTSSGRPNEE